MKETTKLEAHVRTFKIWLVKETLRETRGNRRAAADRLGCHRNTISKLAKELPRAEKVWHRNYQQIAKDQLSAGEGK